MKLPRLASLTSIVLGVLAAQGTAGAPQALNHAVDLQSAGIHPDAVTRMDAHDGSVTPHGELGRAVSKCAFARMPITRGVRGAAPHEDGDDERRGKRSDMDLAGGRPAGGCTAGRRGSQAFDKAVRRAARAGRRVFDQEIKTMVIKLPTGKTVNAAASALQAAVSAYHCGVPCHLSIYEKDGRMVLTTLKATTMLAMFCSPQLAGVAQEVEETIVRILHEAAV